MASLLRDRLQTEQSQSMCQRLLIPTMGQKKKIQSSKKTSKFLKHLSFGVKRLQACIIMLTDGCLIPVICVTCSPCTNFEASGKCPLAICVHFFSHTEKAGSALDWNYLHAYQMVLGMLGLITLKALHLQFKCIPQKQKVIQGKESEGKSVKSTALLPR